jgi:hypothetical protein
VDRRGRLSEAAQIETAWLDVVTTAADCVLPDGSSVPHGSFAPVGSGPYLAARLQLGPGRHVVSSDPVSGVTVYGFSAN